MKLTSRKTQVEPIHCTICHGEQDDSVKFVVCEGCTVRYHLECIDGFDSCPTIGCTTPLIPKKKCWNCNGLGRERVNEMCRAQWYDCNRCAGTGYHVDKDAKPLGVKPKVGNKLNEPTVYSPYQQFPVFSPRDDGKCFHCRYTEEFHSRIDDRCPFGTSVDEADCVFNDRRSALFRQMCVCGYHTSPRHQKEAVEFERMRDEMSRLRHSQQESFLKTSVIGFIILIGMSIIVSILAALLLRSGG